MIRRRIIRSHCVQSNGIPRKELSVFLHGATIPGWITEADGQDSACLSWLPMAGCPLARVNHALAMNEEVIENHFDEIYYELQA